VSRTPLVNHTLDLVRQVMEVGRLLAGALVRRASASAFVGGHGFATADVSPDPAATKPIADRQFEIEFLDSGVEAFVFTFG
jgi:hypothetical protein